MSAEMAGQINAFLKRAFKYGFCNTVYSIGATAEEADKVLFNNRCLLTIVFISCCPLLSQAGTPSKLKDIHISSPDVNMNYIRSLLFLDVCIEIVTVEQSAFLLFAFMCVYLYVS